MLYLLPKLTYCTFPYFSTSITTSGHIRAQNAQPMHLSISITVAGWYPFEFMRSWAITTIPLGQTVVHSSHPLHRSSSKITLAISRLPLSSKIFCFKILIDALMLSYRFLHSYIYSYLNCISAISPAHN